MIRFACPGCAATFTVTDDRAGKAGQCPQCRSQFLIPSEVVPDDGTVNTQPPPFPVPPTPVPPPLPPEITSRSQLPVEIRPCPGCETRLSVEVANVGGDVICPKCDVTFRAIRADTAPPPFVDRRLRGVGSLERLGGGAKESEDDNRERRKARRDEEDERDRDRRRSRRRSGCPGCGSDARPVYRSEISTAGWITFAVLLTSCAPLCWIGLLIKDEYQACGECGRKVR